MVFTLLISAFRSILASPAIGSIIQSVTTCDTKSSDSAKRTRTLRICMVTKYQSSGLCHSLPLHFQLAIRGPAVMIAYQHTIFTFLSVSGLSGTANSRYQNAPVDALHNGMLHIDMQHTCWQEELCVLVKAGCPPVTWTLSSCINFCVAASPICSAAL